MGANFVFDEILPSIQQEDKSADNPVRRVELFSLGGKNFLRIGAMNDLDEAKNRYTVEITAEAAAKLAFCLNEFAHR